VEKVWKMTRKLCTHNRYFAKLEELTNTVSEQFLDNDTRRTRTSNDYAQSFKTWCIEIPGEKMVDAGHGMADSE